MEFGGILPLLPEGSVIVNENLAFVEREGRIIFFNGSGPILSVLRSNKTERRIAQAILGTMKLANPTEISKVFNVYSTTVQRNIDTFREKGYEGFVISPQKVPKTKMTPEVIEKCQKLLDQGKSNSECARTVGVAEGTIRYTIKQGFLHKKGSPKKIKTPSQRAREDNNNSTGIAVKMHSERMSAQKGLLVEAPPQFSAVEAVQGAGVLLGLPFLLKQGLLKIAKEIYGNLNNGFFGLRSVLLILTFMAFLRIKNPEQISTKSPGELGILLGLDRSPEVKTLRRKLTEIAQRQKSIQFMTQLTKHWVETTPPDSIGFMYIDGHVRVYHGKACKLPKTHVARRRLCEPSTTDFWVNDSNSDPLFFVTAEANNGMLSMFEETIIPKIRCEVENEKPITLIFDREGWSPRLFKKWKCQNNIDVLTYRKGSYEPWPAECFYTTRIRKGQKTTSYEVGERSVKMKKNFWMREIRVIGKKNHQTAIMTTRQDISVKDVVIKMFSRWNQENFFKYMRIEYALDHLYAYEYERVDTERRIHNQERKLLKKELDVQKKHLKEQKAEYAEMIIEKTKPKTEINQLKMEIGKKSTEYNCLKEQIDVTLKRIPLKDTQDAKKFIRPERERKTFMETLKMIAYRAESEMFTLIEPFFARQEDEGRKFLKVLFQSTADIIPDEEENLLRVNFHTMAYERYNKTLKALCEIVNEEKINYPDTKYRLVFNMI